MIATPNEGSIFVNYNYHNNPFTPAVYDLMTGLEASQTDMNTNVEYYSISGDIETRILCDGGK
jgi:hypothetical protein